LGRPIHISEKKVKCDQYMHHRQLSFAFWELKKIIPNFEERLPQLEQSNQLKEIISNIENKNWNGARQNWYTKIMKLDLSNGREIDFYEEVEEFFLKYVYIFQTHSLIQKCSESCINDGNMILSDTSSIIEFGRLKDKTTAIISSEFSNCLICKARIKCEINFKHNTLFVFMEPRSHFKLNDKRKL
jgi:hypothetical protein